MNGHSTTKQTKRQGIAVKHGMPHVLQRYQHLKVLYLRRKSIRYMVTRSYVA